MPNLLAGMMDKISINAGGEFIIADAAGGEPGPGGSAPLSIPASWQARAASF